MLFICLLLCSLFELIVSLILCAISILAFVSISILFATFRILRFGLFITSRLFFFLILSILVIYSEPSYLSGHLSLSFVCGLSTSAHLITILYFDILNLLLFVFFSTPQAFLLTVSINITSYERLEYSNLWFLAKVQIFTFLIQIFSFKSVDSIAVNLRSSYPLILF